MIEEMSIAPPQLFTRLERVYQADTVSGTQELRSLIEETLDLVEKHLPQIDLTSQREEFVKPYESWSQPPENRRPQASTSIQQDAAPNRLHPALLPRSDFRQRIILVADKNFG